MKVVKSLKYIIKYFIYLPLFSQDFRLSLFNVIKFKVLHEREDNIVFFDRFSSHYGFSKLLIEKLRVNQKIVLFVGEKEHPALLNKNNNLEVIYLSNKFEILFLLLNISLMITPASGFTKKYKPKGVNLIHMFHSIVSIHYIYGDGAFDAYDTFFAAGPHHIKELERTKKIRRWRNRTFLKVGYPKIEALVNIKKVKKVSSNITILLAPSWGEYNLLKLHGVEIILKVLNHGYNIIVRPHPHSFMYDMQTINRIKEICENDKRCKIEDSNFDGMDSYYESDMMISDWSGAAYEYAFGLLKPVLFIDIPKKLSNNSHEQIDFLPMEVTCRERIGVISKIDDFEISLHEIMAKQDNWKDLIKEVRKDYIFNSSNSIKKILSELKKLKGVS